MFSEAETYPDNFIWLNKRIQLKLLHKSYSIFTYYIKKKKSKYELEVTCKIEDITIYFSFLILNIDRFVFTSLHKLGKGGVEVNRLARYTSARETLKFTIENERFHKIV